MTAKNHQVRMFQFEDLPLFSGAPAGVVPAPAPVEEKVTQETWATCRACLDTGEIYGKCCWCEASDKARLKKGQAK